MANRWGRDSARSWPMSSGESTIVSESCSACERRYRILTPLVPAPARDARRHGLHPIKTHSKRARTFPGTALAQDRAKIGPRLAHIWPKFGRRFSGLMRAPYLTNEQRRVECTLNR